MLWVLIRIASANICCGYSLESPGRGNSNEYPHVFIEKYAKLSLITEYPPICSTAESIVSHYFILIRNRNVEWNVCFASGSVDQL